MVSNEQRKNGLNMVNIPRFARIASNFEVTTVFAGRISSPGP